MASTSLDDNGNIHPKSAAREIHRAIKQSDSQIRQTYTFLCHQDWIGGIIFISSLLLMLLISYFYSCNCLSAISTIILMAIPISLLHELEHDIIHNLYFKKYRWVQNIMFSFIWLAKLHISPWYRRQLHLKHHLLSGQKNDAEERFIGLGLAPSYKRMAVSMHPFAGLLVADEIIKDAKFFSITKIQLYNAPIGLAFATINLLFLGYNFLFYTYFLFNYDVNMIAGVQTVYPIVHALAVCLCIPNVLRQACLVLMSNSSHYYGDIPMNTVYYQNQILDSWYVFPFQLFCFNFGATHIVHHYFPSQPFYIRHMTARSVKDIMLKLGVRHNDFGILWRNNHYTINPEEDQKQRLYGKLWFLACVLLGFALYIVWDVLVIHKFAKNVITMLKILLSKDHRITVGDTVNNEKLFYQKGMDNAMDKLNVLTDRIALGHVLANQVEELNDMALES